MSILNLTDRPTQLVSEYLDEGWLDEKGEQHCLESIVSSVFQQQQAGFPYLDWRQRPEEIQQAIHVAYDVLFQETVSKWGSYDGENSYDLCGISDGQLLKTIIQRSPREQKHFYVLDVGAGNFQLGAALSRFINEQSDLPSGITVHIVSVRGEYSLEEETVQEGQCVRHNLGGVVIEELERELEQRGLTRNFDLIESRWCLRHLVDPVGTFAQCFNLLRPYSGLFLGDGFFFLTNREREPAKGANQRMVQLLLDLGSPFLMEHYDISCSLNRFILRRLDAALARLPFQYAGLIRPGLQSPFAYVTQFKRMGESPLRVCNLPVPPITPTGMAKLCGSRSLFQWLKQEELIEDRLKWGPAYKVYSCGTCDYHTTNRLNWKRHHFCLTERGVRGKIRLEKYRAEAGSYEDLVAMAAEFIRQQVVRELALQQALPPIVAVPLNSSPDMTETPPAASEEPASLLPPLKRPPPLLI